MTAASRRPFPFVARRRVHLVGAGTNRGAHRGAGTDIVGARPYRPGDRLATIDWAASAKLATARGEDAFLVREHLADVALRAVVVADRRPSNGIAAPPWLDKPAAVHEAATAIALSAAAAHGAAGFLDVAGGRVRWAPPRPRARPSAAPPRFDAPPDALTRSLAHLRRTRVEAPGGTFVFVLSDFLDPPAVRDWHGARAAGWDAVPVVVQDPVWERSFPAVGGVLLPVRDPATGRIHGVRLSSREAAARREANERRFDELLLSFAQLGLDPVTLDSSDPGAVDASFLAWAAARRRQARR